MDKPVGKGKGAFSNKGAQAAQAADIEVLKALVADYGARLDAIEAGEAVDLDPEVPFDPDAPHPDQTLPGDLPAE